MLSRTVLLLSIVAGLGAIPTNPDQPATKPPPVHLVGVYVFPFNTPQPQFAFAQFAPDRAKVVLGDPLPAPNDRWHLAEVNDKSPEYVVLRDAKTGQRAVVWQEPVPAHPPTIAGRIPLPLPPWPGLGFVTFEIRQERRGGKAVATRAYLTGGAYTQDCLIGDFGVGDQLPKPWDKWRVVEIVHRSTTPTDWDNHCTVRSDDGQTVVLPWRQSIDLPHDAPLVMPTTLPATTQPAT